MAAEDGRALFDTLAKHKAKEAHRENVRVALDMVAGHGATAKNILAPELQDISDSVVRYVSSSQGRGGPDLLTCPFP